MVLHSAESPMPLLLRPENRLQGVLSESHHFSLQGGLQSVLHLECWKHGNTVIKACILPFPRSVRQDKQHPGFRIARESYSS